MDIVSISFLLYIVAMIAFGAYSARFAHNTSDDFFLAG